MSKAQNNHLHLILPISKVSKLIKFCYFITAFLLVACGNNQSDKTATEPQSSEQIENTIQMLGETAL